MTDVEALVTDLLARSAAAVEVRPDLDGVVAAEPRGIGPTGGAGGRARVLLVAAVVVAVALVGGALLLGGDGRTDSVDVVTVPPAPPVPAAPMPEERYPVLDVLPASVSGTVFAHVVDPAGPPVEPLADEVPTVRAVITHTRDDGAVDHIVTVQAALAPFDPDSFGTGGQPVTVAGRPATLVRGEGEGATGFVVLHGPPSVVVSGPGDLLALLDDLGPDDLVATPTSDGSGVDLHIGDLPPGYRVAVPPGPLPATPRYQLSLDAPDGRTVIVEAGGDVPLAALASTGTAAPVTVGGRPGWQVAWTEVTSGDVPLEEGDQGSIVAWTAPNGVNLVLDVQGLTADEALEVAGGVRLVDEATWRGLHGTGPDAPGLEVGSGTTAPR